MTYEEYLAQCSDANRTLSWRKGQHYFNMLYRVRPDLSEAIRRTELDPFYDDSRLPAMLEWVQAMWEANR